MTKMRYERESLEQAVRCSDNIAQVLERLNKKKNGGAYRSVGKLIKKWEIDDSHFIGKWDQEGNKPRLNRNKWEFPEILVEHSPYKKTHDLKNRLIEAGFFERKCYRCQRTEWEGNPIPIEMDHINGDRTDNRLENLKILCPNCHALTETYAGKNKKYRAEADKIRKENPFLKKIIFIDPKKLEEDLKMKSAVVIGKELGTSEGTIRSYCKSNNIKIPYKNELRKKFEVSKEELEKLVAEKPFTQIGTMFGVSDNSIRCRCRKLGIEIPQNRKGYYWRKKVL